MISFIFIGLAAVLTSFTLSAKKDDQYLTTCLLISIPIVILLVWLSKYLKNEVTKHSIDKSTSPDTHLTLKEMITGAIASVISITFMSTSSPLYPFNLWNDADLFLTMGRSIKNGQVPYRDLYEQKGPLLYFIHSLCALISDRTFFGVYILESIMCFIFIIFAWKIVKLFIKDVESTGAIILTLPLCAIIYSSNMFHLGDSTEELTFPLLTIVLYFALKALRTDNTLPSWKETLITGVIGGIIFWTKFNLCAFIAGFAVFFLIYSIVIHQINNLLKCILAMITGVAAVSLPILIYFKVNDALEDLFTVYFYNNIFLYNSTSGGILHKLTHSIPTGFGLVFRHNHGLLAILMLALITFIVFNRRTAIFLLTVFTTMMIGAFSGSFVIFYYGFIFMTFTAILLIPATCLYNDAIQKLSQKRAHTALSIGILISIVSLIIYSGSKNLSLIGKPYDETPQAIFATEIEKTPNARILTYDVMDMGFFISSGNDPSNRYFCYLNIVDELPDIRESQDSLINDGYFDYIITYNDTFEWDGYEVVMQSEYSIPYSNGITYDYDFYLYKKIS